jgi:uncharacterized protein YukE
LHLHLIVEFEKMNAFKQTLNRAKQTVEEKFGDAAKTEFDPETQRLLQLAADVKSHTECILSAVQIYLQPDPAIRILPGLTQEGTNKPEQLSLEMNALGNKLGASHNYGSAMLAGADAFNTIGRSEREFLSASQTAYVVPLKRFLQEEIKLLDQERQTLSNRRLDMDALKNKVKSNAQVPASTQQELDKAQKAFDEQVEKVKSAVHKIEEQLPELRKHLKNLVEKQLEHANNVQKALNELHKKL